MYSTVRRHRRGATTWRCLATLTKAVCKPWNDTSPQPMLMVSLMNMLWLTLSKAVVKSTQVRVTKSCAH